MRTQGGHWVGNHAYVLSRGAQRALKAHGHSELCCDTVLRSHRGGENSHHAITTEHAVVQRLQHDAAIQRESGYRRATFCAQLSIDDGR